MAEAKKKGGFIICGYVHDFQHEDEPELVLLDKTFPTQTDAYVAMMKKLRDDYFTGKDKKAFGEWMSTEKITDPKFQLNYLITWLYDNKDLRAGYKTEFLASA